MKLKLDLNELTEEFFHDTRLLGIVTHLKNYQLCWQLNQILGFDFRNNVDIEIQLKKKDRHYYFSVYQYCEKTTSLIHYLYNNQYDGEYLLPEFRHLDFLWLLKGDNVSERSLHELMDAIKSIKGVQLVLELVPEKIKNKGHLIF